MTLGVKSKVIGLRKCFYKVKLNDSKTGEMLFSSRDFDNQPTGISIGNDFIQLLDRVESKLI